MRLIRMNTRSRYKGLSCLHCHKRIGNGRVVFASTYYVMPHRPGWVTTYSRKRLAGRTDVDLLEHEIRVVYHRACIENILGRGPEDHEVMRSRYDAYRDHLLEAGYRELDP